MRLAWFAFVLVAGCNNDLTPAGFAMFDGPERVTTSHATTGFKSYGGAPLATSTVTLTTLDGCTANGKVLDMEIDVLSNGTFPPTDTAIPFRPVADTVDALPSAVLAYNANTLTSGTVTLDAISTTEISGNFTFMAGGTTFTGKFTGPVCPAM